MTTVYFSLGSNLGDRAENLRQAALLLEEGGVIIQERSRIYATQSQEDGGREDFLNAALSGETDLTPQGILDLIAEIESRLGRPASGDHRPGARLIDIDLLAYGDEILNTPELVLPHPRMHRRSFVLRPLLDVLPGGWVKESEYEWK